MKKLSIILLFSILLSGCNEKFVHCQMPQEVSNGLNELMLQKNYEAAISKLLPFAKKGEPSAQVYLAVVLGLTKPKDAFIWNQRAAKQKCIGGAIGIAIAYREGHGTEKDLNKSFMWFLKLAKSGHKFSAKVVSELYAAGKGVKIDEDKSYYWLEKSRS